MTLRLYNVTTAIPKYYNGQWTWNKRTEKFEFYNTSFDSTTTGETTELRSKFGTQFKNYMNEIEENTFRHKFARSDSSRDADVITIQDIKDVVLFLTEDGALSHSVLEFLHTESYDQFLNYLIIYFEYFLKLVEFLMIRRDEIKEKMRDGRSVQIERMLSDCIAQTRLLLAREYSKIVLGCKDFQTFHHLANKSKQSKTGKDSIFYETVFCICKQAVWIAMHRKCYNIIGK